jgi:hypothetical protein
MLNRLDKVAPYLAMALFAYLAYSATADRTAGAPAARKTPAAIGKKLLSVKLAEPSPGASPVGRDPFEVGWASYRPVPSAPKPPPAASRPASRPTSLPATKPAAAKLPPLPKRFTAVITAQHFQMAIIDDCICKPGSLVGGSDPAQCWRVEAITRNRVTLCFGEIRRVLTIAEEEPPSKARK